MEQKRLANGIRVNMISMADEPQRASVRLYVPGGRMLESMTKPGAVLVGSRTIQEGNPLVTITIYTLSHHTIFFQPTYFEW